MFDTISAMRVALLTVDGMFDSGLTVLMDVLSTANALSDQAQLPASPFVATPVGLGRSVRTAHGLELATTPLSEVPTPHLLVTPALGLRPPEDIVAEVCGHPALPTLGDLCEQGVGMAAACSGTFFLAEAGVLDNITATTSWWLGPAFRTRYPQVHLDESRALAIADNVTTAGAAFSHIDLGLSIVRRVSPVLADLVARFLVVGIRPSQASAAMPSVLARGNPVLSSFEGYVRSNLAGDLRVAVIARSIGASERTLQRITLQTMGMSPIQFIQEIRLDQATFLLRTTSRTPDAIATAVGYRNVSTLRSLARRRRGSTLSALRGVTPPAG